jgi:uncharacterized protein YjeT (DUF2065 family)
MRFDWQLLFTAIGLACVFEGLPYFLFAERMPRVLLTLAGQPPRHLRIMGLTAIILGVLLVSFGRSF